MRALNSSLNHYIIPKTERTPGNRIDYDFFTRFTDSISSLAISAIDAITSFLNRLIWKTYSPPHTISPLNNPDLEDQLVAAAVTTERVQKAQAEQVQAAAARAARVSSPTLSSDGSTTTISSDESLGASALGGPATFEEWERNTAIRKKVNLILEVNLKINTASEIINKLPLEEAPILAKLTIPQVKQKLEEYKQNLTTAKTQQQIIDENIAKLPDRKSEGLKDLKARFEEIEAKKTNADKKVKAIERKIQVIQAILNGKIVEAKRKENLQTVKDIFNESINKTASDLEKKAKALALRAIDDDLSEKPTKIKDLKEEAEKTLQLINEHKKIVNQFFDNALVKSLGITDKDSLKQIPELTFIYKSFDQIDNAIKQVKTTIESLQETPLQSIGGGEISEEDAISTPQAAAPAKLGAAKAKEPRPLQTIGWK